MNEIARRYLASLSTCSLSNSSFHHLLRTLSLENLQRRSFPTGGEQHPGTYDFLHSCSMEDILKKEGYYDGKKKLLQ